MEFAKNIQAFRHQLSEVLLDLYDSSEAKALATQLSEHFAPFPRHILAMEPEMEFDVGAFQEVVNAAKRLTQGEPLQYIIGLGHFYGRDFKVTPDTLIPRRETEELVVWIRDEWKDKASRSNFLQALDIGTGTGCIPISLDLEWRDIGINAKITGIDIDPNVIAIANENAQQLKSKVNFQQLDIFKAAPSDFTQLDIVISNPPYVTESEKSELHTNVLKHEPHLALFVSDSDPLVYYRKIGELAMQWLRPTGILYLEINEQFGAETIELLKTQGWDKTMINRDLQNKDRMVRAEKPA